MSSVKISIRGHVVKYFPGEKECFEVSLVEPQSVADLLVSLGVDPLLIMMVTINGTKQPKTALVYPNDEVLLISPPAGG